MYESLIYLIAVCRTAVSFTLGVAIHPKSEETAVRPCPAMPWCRAARPSGEHGARRAARVPGAAAGVLDGTGRCAARAGGRCCVLGSSGEVAGATTSGAPASTCSVRTRSTMSLSRPPAGPSAIRRPRISSRETPTNRQNSSLTRMYRNSASTYTEATGDWSTSAPRSGRPRGLAMNASRGDAG
jgi:hypothetical protein